MTRVFYRGLVMAEFEIGLLVGWEREIIELSTYFRTEHRIKKEGSNASLFSNNF